jgi:hypothetical protein
LAVLAEFVFVTTGLERGAQEQTTKCLILFDFADRANRIHKVAFAEISNFEVELHTRNAVLSIGRPAAPIAAKAFKA